MVATKSHSSHRLPAVPSPSFWVKAVWQQALWQFATSIGSITAAQGPRKEMCGALSVSASEMVQKQETRCKFFNWSKCVRLALLVLSLKIVHASYPWIYFTYQVSFTHAIRAALYVSNPEVPCDGLTLGICFFHFGAIFAQCICSARPWKRRCEESPPPLPVHPAQRQH